MRRLVILLYCICIPAVELQWVDPHSMDSNAKRNLPDNSHKTADYEISQSKEANCISDVYLKRLIRLILSNTRSLDKNGEQFKGYLNVELSVKEYEFLLNFSKGENNVNNAFDEVHSIFEVALQKPSLEDYKETILSYQEELYFVMFNPTSGILAVSFLVLYITYRLLKAKFTWKLIIKYILLFMYVADFVMTYLRILQKEEIDNMVTLKQLGTTPPECDVTKMSWMTYMKTQYETIFFQNPCHAYYQALNPTIVYLVTPSKVLIAQFRTFIVEPFGDIGEAFGKFGRSMFANLPWGLNVVLFPVMLILFICIVFIIFLFIKEPNFKLSLLHLFTIEMGHPKVISNRESKSKNKKPMLRDSKRPEKLDNNIKQKEKRTYDKREVEYDKKHRQLIEDVSPSNHSSCRKEVVNTPVRLKSSGVCKNTSTKSEP